MGFGEFIIICFVVVVIAAVGTWALKKFVPECPPVVHYIIWGVAIFIIVVTLSRAVGIMNHDPQIPRVN